MTTTASGGSGSSGGGTDWTGMVLAGLGSMFANSASQSNIKAENEGDYLWSGRLMRYKAALDDYYKLRDRQEMRNAAGEYGKFSTLDQWAPGYTQTYQPLQAPNAPPLTRDTLTTGSNSYYADYRGGSNTGIPGGNTSGSATSLDPHGYLRDDDPNSHSDWLAGRGGP